MSTYVVTGIGCNEQLAARQGNKQVERERLRRITLIRVITERPKVTLYLKTRNNRL